MEKNYYIRTFDCRLACAIGENGAIIVSQIDYWLEIEKERATADEAIRKKHYINGRWWIYNTYEQWQQQFPFLSLSTIKREFSKLIDIGVVISDCYNSKGYDRTKWYTLDYEILEKCMDKESVKMNQWNSSKYAVGEGQYAPTNTIEYSNTTPVDYLKGIRDCNAIGTPKNEYSINWNILKNQIRKACMENNQEKNTEYCYKIVKYYFIKYKNCRGKNHPRLSTKHVNGIIEKLLHGTDIFEPHETSEWQALIDKYFETYFEDCDYHIMHFLSDNVINNRFYEELY